MTIYLINRGLLEVPTPTPFDPFHCEIVLDGKTVFVPFPQIINDSGELKVDFLYKAEPLFTNRFASHGDCAAARVLWDTKSEFHESIPVRVE